ncbi:MAG: hypothetical protein ACRCZY_08210 [Phocaeicola sp.]
MRNVRLTEEENKRLKELHKTSPDLLVRKRSMSLLLSNQGNCISAVADMMSVHRHTIERLLESWELSNADDKFSVLYSLEGRGAKVKLASVADILPALIKQHNRNLKPILEILEKEHSIKVCKLTLQNFLKGTGL